MHPASDLAEILPRRVKRTRRPALLEQGGFSRDATELALDHIHDTDVVRAYDRGERLEERIRMDRW